MCLWFDSHHPLFVCNECAKNESISFLAFFILDKLYTFSLLTCFFLCYPIVIALEKRTELRRFFLWKRKQHSKTFPAKQRYNRDYYRWHIVAAICLVAFAISMIVHYASYRESVLDIVMVNTLDPYEESVSSTDEFFEQEGFTKKEEVTVDTSITFSDDDNYSTNYYSDQKLTLKLSVGGADVLFSPEFVFQQYADVGSLMPLTDYLTADELEQYKDMIVYATDSETGETFPCGLELNDNQWLSDYGYYTGTICFGIAYAANNKENAVDSLISSMAFCNSPAALVKSSITAFISPASLL